MKKLFRLIFYCPAPAARTVGHFTLSLEAKSASSSRVPMPSCSERAASAFHCPASAARLFGGFASSYKAKSAFTSEAPSPSQSERAASAFHCPAPPPSPSCLRTFRTRRQKASSVRKNLSQQG
ncbi:hypothetical protein BK743_28090 [Bacillus thuringiensis serovar sylvestriensis]|nr:hypothetical protein BK743_28090 [Bacillus thuringiensis serovar sylvestriensis]